MLTAAFVSHIPELVEGPNAPDLWVHGHTHAAFDYRAGKCRVIGVVCGRGRNPTLSAEDALSVLA